MSEIKTAVMQAKRKREKADLCWIEIEKNNDGQEKKIIRVMLNEKRDFIVQ